MKHIFVINPAAGQVDSTNEIKSYLEQNHAELDYEIYVTTDIGDATRFVSDYCRQHDGEAVRFYACGGDGTLCEVVSGAAERENVQVAVYPVGSGNDFVKYYGGKQRFMDLGALIDAPAEAIDLIKVGDRYSINVCNFGFDTTVAKTMIKVKRNKIFGGKRAYVTGVATAVLTARFNKCIVTADGEQLNDKKILLCTLANGKYVGGAFQCAPRSVNNDGLIDVCLIKTMSLFGFIKLLGPYTDGKHLDLPAYQQKIVYRRAKHIHVSAPEGFAVSVDGEIVEGTEFDIEVCPGALNFVIPPLMAEVKNEEKESAVC